MADIQRKRSSELGAAAGDQPKSKKLKAVLGGMDATGLDGGDDQVSGKGINGVADEDMHLENFRKEAIWRQMQEYKRELARAQEQLQTLEGFKAGAEARIAAVDVCWTQLIADVRMLFEGANSEPAPSSSQVLEDPILSLPSTSTASFSEALSTRASASKDLILHFLSRSPRPSASLNAADIEEVRARCRTLTAESASSRAALGLAESKIKQLSTALEEAEERLRKAEKRLDRERSRIVKEVEGRLTPGEGSSSEPAKDENEAKVKEEDGQGKNGIAKAEVDGPVAIVNGVDPADLDGARDLAEARLNELEKMQGLLAERTAELDKLRLQASQPSDGVVKESATYRRLDKDYVALQAEVEKAKLELEAVQTESNGLREKQEEFRTAVLFEANSQLEELEKKLAIRDADAVRLRQTREEARAELLEVKTRDGERMRQVDEIRTLANSRAERVEALQSEVRRCRMALAAARGEGELVEAYSGAGEEDSTKALLERVKSAEQLALALRDQLTNLTKSSGVTDRDTLLRSEQEARVQVLNLQSRISHLEALIGPDSGQPDVAEMAQRLEKKEAEVKVLEAKQKEKDSVAEMMYGEVDRLSSAWQLLDEQNRSKVFKLAESEEKILKAVHEKAKADNKYFAAMRTNEALKGENALLEKVTQKQSATIEKLSDELKIALSRMTTVEKELTAHEKAVDAHKAKVVELTSTNEDVNNRFKSAEKQLHDAQSSLAERAKQIEAEVAARHRAEEQSTKASKELERTSSKLSAVKAGTAQTAELAELKSYNEDLTRTLKCSSCATRFKSHIINRCGHLFCGQCLESRIETRQRRCPKCQVGFGAQDVSQVFF